MGGRITEHWGVADIFGMLLQLGIIPAADSDLSPSVTGCPRSFGEGRGERARSPLSLLKAIAEVDDAATESMLVDELQIDARVGRQRGGAPTEHDWPHEQCQFDDHPSDDSLRCQVRAATNRSLLAAAFRSRTALGSK